MQPTGPCPADAEEIAEAYVMGTLNAADAEAFEEHYFACADCQAILHQTIDYVDSMRAAAREVRVDQPRSAAFSAGHGSN